MPLLLMKERHKQVLTLKQHSNTFCFSFVFSGGYTVGPKPLIELLRQRSRPYLFSNSLPPPVVACATRSVELLLASSEIAQSMTAKTMRYPVQGLKCNMANWNVGLIFPLCTIFLYFHVAEYLCYSNLATYCFSAFKSNKTYCSTNLGHDNGGWVLLIDSLILSIIGTSLALLRNGWRHEVILFSLHDQVQGQDDECWLHHWGLSSSHLPSDAWWCTVGISDGWWYVETRWD